MERLPYWYSVVKYVPNNTRRETINIGIIAFSLENKKFKHYFLNHNNIKLKSFLYYKHEINDYKIFKDFAERNLKNIKFFEEDDVYNFEDLKTVKFLSLALPSQFIIEEIGLMFTNKFEEVFELQLNKYIGKEFLHKKQRKLPSKTKIETKFNKFDLFETKIIKKVPIYHESVPTLKYNYDYAYKNGVMNYMDTVPDTKQKLDNWYLKLNTFAKFTSRNSNIILFRDSEYKDDEDEFIAGGMIRSLSETFENIDSMFIESQRFDDLCYKIYEEGKDFSDFKEELDSEKKLVLI